jgi:peptidoglycan/xylan/chitin deacetylase (PgdA/CDA1 family)
MNQKNKGTLVISLDFELLWGMTDKANVETYKENVAGVWGAIPRILKTFDEYGIHATWATVGMLAHDSYSSLQDTLPPTHLRPKYSNPSQSTYFYLEQQDLANNLSDSNYYFGDELIRLIHSHSNQEIASHTFSHLYALDMENEDTVCKADCDAINASLEKYKIKPRSLVFPRNQINKQYLKYAKDTGIRCYRGNQDHFFYHARTDKKDSLVVRGLRLLDNYFNISGHHTYSLNELENETSLCEIAASRFLRPYTPRLAFLDRLRIRRIKKSMTFAALRGEVFHLWWHPHNFGKYTEKNLEILVELLVHFRDLKNQYDMESKNMKEVATDTYEERK